MFQKRLTPAWIEGEHPCSPDGLVVVVVEYTADGQAIERERAIVPPHRPDSCFAALTPTPAWTGGLFA